jgi:DtxR family Mn-dependent transcriptional regulator
VIVGDLVRPLTKALGHPTTCPHGNPIPTNGGGILEGPSIPLDTLEEGEDGLVVKIVNEKRELLEYLLAMKLIPGVHVEVVKAPFKEPITVRVNGRTHALSREIASNIWVKLED